MLGTSAFPGKGKIDNCKGILPKVCFLWTKRLLFDYEIYLQKSTVGNWSWLSCTIIYFINIDNQVVVVRGSEIGTKLLHGY